MSLVPRAATTSDAFNAVAEPRRREILSYLALKERPVGDIVKSLEAGAAFGLKTFARAQRCRAGARAPGGTPDVVSNQCGGDPAAARVDQHV